MRKILLGKYLSIGFLYNNRWVTPRFLWVARYDKGGYHELVLGYSASNINSEKSTSKIIYKTEVVEGFTQNLDDELLISDASNELLGIIGTVHKTVKEKLP